jgi:putative heme transporter
VKTPQPLQQPPQVVRFELAPQSLALILAVAGGLWLVGQLAAILLTVVCALILVGTLTPLVDWLQKKHVPRTLAVVLVFGTAAVLATLAGLLTLPPLWDQTTEVLGALPHHQAKLAHFLSQYKATAWLSDSVRHFDVAKLGGEIDVNSALSVSFTVIEGVGLAVTAVVLAIYVIADRDRMRGALYALIPRSFHLRLARVLANLETFVGGYIRGQMLTSLAIAIFTFALLSICGVPNPLALAAFAGLTDVLPFIGGLLATAPAVLAAIPQGSITATVVLVALLSYQEFESRILVPKVYGRALRLPAIVVVLALVVGGKLGGILGALLALPLAASLRMLADEARMVLPGDDTDHSALQASDATAEQAYAVKSAGTTAQEAGAMATEIAEHNRATELEKRERPETKE